MKKKIVQSSALQRTMVASDHVDLVDPSTAELVDPTDLDALIEAWQRICAHNAQVYAFMTQIKLAMLRAATFPEGRRSARLEGSKQRVLLSLPPDTWDARALREIATRLNPYLAERWKILPATYSMPAAEFNKLVGTSSKGNEFREFKEAVLAARRPGTGAPTIKIEDA